MQEKEHKVKSRIVRVRNKNLIIAILWRMAHERVNP